jgi:hypothetical protein
VSGSAEAGMLVLGNGAAFTDAQHGRRLHGRCSRS